MSDHERIWLQNADDARATGDRLWCQDKVWPECDEQQEPTEYIRADLYASRISQQDAELERLRRENKALSELRRDLITLQKRIIGETGLSAIETIDRALKVFDAKHLYEVFDEDHAKSEETRT